MTLPYNDLAKKTGQALDFLLPESCIFCGALAAGTDFPYICRRCLAALPLRFATDMVLSGHRYKELSIPVYCAAYYEDPIKTAIVRLKFADDPAISVSLSRLMELALTAVKEPINGLVAVPLHHKRLASRGYNQAQLLSGILCDHLQLPDLSCGLLRIRETGRQTEVEERSLRLVNPRGAFAADLSFWQDWLSRVKISPGDCRLILLDDVLTTGGTITAAAAPLLSLGFKVSGLVLAAGQAP